MCDVKIGRLGKFDFNPRGELWRKDESRFGHKFLTKFGWSQGKGLGKNEDGIAENLKVRLKVGNTGVGWDEKLPIGIDYREYDAVLEDLSKKYQKSGEVKNESISLEKRSQQFKNRIHYQKFVRGKDTSRYSEKDMSCIFLSREPEKDTESAPKESSVTNTESQPSQLLDKESMPTFNSQMSVADYFAMKMKNKTGSSFNASKESKNCKEPPEPEIDVKSKKRKHELKLMKKAKRMKQEPQLDTYAEKSAYQEDISELSNSSQEAPEEDLVSSNSEELINSKTIKRKKKASKKIKKFLETFKFKQDLISNGQEKHNTVQEGVTEKESDQSNESCSDSPGELEIVVENEAIRKKRKKEQKSSKKAKKLCLETEISIGVYKNISHSESDEVKINSSEECSDESLENEKQSRKESKKHKNKISNLKSCLKGCLSNNKYSFKEKRRVSFCESISYKIIENVLNNVDSDIVLETNEQLLSCSDDDGEVVNEAENLERSPAEDSNLSVNSTESNEKISDELELTDVFCDEKPENLDLAEDNTVPECFKLPKRGSANYDSWLETQRIAARMKVYKNMAKKMKKHPVLRKTNLLEIKGYGNWGI